jgi:uncharacterized iron-regulated membrane protein
MAPLSPPWLLMILLLAGVQILFAVWIDHRLEQRFARQLTDRPPLRVLDLSGALRDASPTELGIALKARERLAKQLARQGVLVLDQGSGRVLAAPPALLVELVPGVEAHNDP